MKHIDWQIERMREYAERPAIAWRGDEYTYADLQARYDEWLGILESRGVSAGDCVGVVADYSPAALGCLLALVKLRCILVPMSWDSADQHEQFCRIAELDWRIEIDAEDRGVVASMDERRGHAMLEDVRKSEQAGLILFSSGSTGAPKAALHRLEPLFEKFRKPRHCYRTLLFLLFDHIGGFNTLFYTLANGGFIVSAGDRSVSNVCRTIARHRVELLPTSPSFLNLLLLADAQRSFDLSSVELVTYGTEVMPERTLRLANAAFPGARFLQTYGLTELGILRSKSESNDSLFVKVGGEDYETRVVDGRLHIRARSSMIGYLNAPSPFDEDGWFDTNDAVIQDGEYLRILGRESDLINVGGQKVYPAEVEQVVAELDDVIDVAVHGEESLIMGHAVVATVQMTEPVSPVKMRRRIAQHCKGRLQPFMIPTKVKVVTDSPVNYRFKKIRR